MLGCRAPHAREAPGGQGPAVPVRWSCRGSFPECSVCAEVGLGPVALPGPALHKRRSAADAAGDLQGESQLLGRRKGGREEGGQSAVGSSARAER